LRNYFNNFYIEIDGRKDETKEKCLLQYLLRRRLNKLIRLYIVFESIHTTLVISYISLDYVNILMSINLYE